MTNISHRLLLLLLLTLSAASIKINAEPPKANEIIRRKYIAEQKELLSKATTAKDSLQGIFNLFDLYTNSEKQAEKYKFILTAKKSGNPEAFFELVRLYAAIRQESDYMQWLLDQVNTFPDSQSKKETVAFVKISGNSYNSSSDNEASNEKALQDAIEDVEQNLSDDVYERIVQRHNAIIYLALALKGKVFKEYFDDYLADIYSLPDSVFSLRSSAYTQACRFFRQVEDYPNAIKYNKLLLAYIDTLENYHETMNRSFKKYDTQRYLRYYNLLTCYNHSMPVKDVKHYYAAVLDLADKSIEVKEDMEENQGPQIYYYYATEDYKTALDILKTQIDRPEHKLRKKRLLEMMIKCAGKVGDIEALDKAASEYITLTNEYVSDRSYETYRKLQIGMDIKKLRREKKELEDEIHRKEIDMADARTQAAVIFIIILAAIVVILLFLYIKNRRLTGLLEKKNNELEIERDSLESTKEDLQKSKEAYEYESRIKTTFIGGISNNVTPSLDAIVENSRLVVDCIDNSSKPYLHKFTNLIEQNVNVLKSVMNDIVTFTELHSSDVQLNYSGVNINRVCQDCINTISSRKTNPDVNLRFTPPENITEYIITTDVQRVEQVILQLLSNAVKFTEKGEIVLSYTINTEKNTITISVTDTGIGIPKSQAEKIFERYFKLDKHSIGLGIGLTIARMITGFLGGSVILDTTYKGGARFLFTIPTNITIR